jgi:alanine-glyoxylate transaminase/serine-glyoxylate transaminase/serine-pyruvate transaminase
VRFGNVGSQSSQPGPTNSRQNPPGDASRWGSPFVVVPALVGPILKDLRKVFKTESGQVIIFPGTGTGGWESALVNTLSPGDKVLSFRYGQFSHLWIDMMQRLGLDVTAIDVEWGGAPPGRSTSC